MSRFRGFGRYGCKLAPLIVAARMPTAPIRAVPGVLIIGAQKSGTTSLFKWLSASPSFVRPLQKEVHYFTLNYHRSEAWYRAHFPLERRCRKALTGEATPYMLYHEDAPQRVRHMLPGVKLVAILRDPVLRAWSHYWHERRKGRETLSFEDAIYQEDRRVQEPTGHQWHSYLSRGLYGEQLERWMQYFPRSQFFIVDAEEGFGNPQSITDQVCEWLGIESAPVKRVVTNQGDYVKPISPTLYRELWDYYEKDQRKLADILGSGRE